MEIIILVLKIFGIAVLTLLGIAVSLFLAVLLIPIRYHLKGQAQSLGEMQGSIVVSWLLHLIHIRITYAQHEWSTVVRILGIPFPLLKHKEDSEKADSLKEETKEETKQETKQEIKQETKQEMKYPFSEESSEPLPVKLSKEEIPIGNFAAIQDLEMLEAEPDTRDKEVTNEKTPNDTTFHHKLLKWKDAIRTLYLKIKNTPRQILALFQTLKEKKEQGTKVLSDIIKIFTEKAYQDAVAHLFLELKYLLRHYTPKKVSGTLAFGMENPAQTGQLLGICSMLPFWYRYQITLQPDFESEKSYIKGNMNLTGHLRIIHLLRVVIRLLADSNIRRIIKQIRK